MIADGGVGTGIFEGKIVVPQHPQFSLHDIILWQFNRNIPYLCLHMQDALQFLQPSLLVHFRE